jgi:hypothetical protein
MMQTRVKQVTAELEAAPVAEPVAPPYARFRRRFESFRGDADAIRSERSGDDVDLELTVMLLREENARLKAERHRPPGIGVMVDRLRVIAVPSDQGEGAEDVWGLLGECLALHEGLYRACAEIQDSMTALEERLAELNGPAAAPAARVRSAPHEIEELDEDLEVLSSLG